ncbi:MAG: precorrin-8X methylmutase [Desulfobacterium sp.]|nr:precorrin-8X methylmutase [Desulfobacterium sp.]MBU3950376.1 precorrin-8X methylmutase [Pseudomonadota bacterium]MBU4009765.1 precorrin-8X methylmutase [Pseudomonadota bacterium]MBU4037949.1 precorrin-8X methylmutase [Pseudomonadota bacterium]
MINLGAGINPEDIEKKSFAIIDSEVPEPRPFQNDEWKIARRLVHTSADFELLSLLCFHPDAVTKGIEALLSGCTIVTDTEMARMGITSGRMNRLSCHPECFINNEQVKENALAKKTTRASAALDYSLPYLDGGIYVVGNAPTALIRLLQLVNENKCRPALIVGMPVGFVNAAESKELLIMQKDVPFITITGRKGGSALAACVVNQLAELALMKKEKKN